MSTSIISTRSCFSVLFLLGSLLLLTACGGGGGGGGNPPPPQNYTVGGTVSGLAGSGLVLQNNGGDDLAIAGDGAFTFAGKITEGKAYAVTVLAQPGNPSQTCTVTNGGGTIAGADVSNVTVTCVTDTFTVGGAVSGLAGSGLVLQNNGGDDLAIDVDGPFTFTGRITDGEAYTVTVLAQPGSPSQTCSVTDGSGTLAGADVGNVTVTCVTDTFTVGGTVTGLTATGLVLRNNGGDDLTVDADGSFRFATAVPSGGSYAVSVAATPDNPNHACYATRNRGGIDTADVNDVVVSCQSLAGNFIDPMTRQGPYGGVGAIAVGDLDGDGDLDLVRADRKPDQVNASAVFLTVWHNDGKGGYSDSGQALADDGLEIGDVVLDDFDGDGDLDLFIARGNYNESVVLINDGNGAFADSGQSLGQVAGFSARAVATDVDGDGDRDIVVSSPWATPSIEVLRNRGDGTFDSSLVANDTLRTDLIALADLDGDGAPEIIANQDGGKSSVWQNDGTGGFTVGQRLGLDTDSFLGLTTGDIDGDGDTDVVLSGNTSRVFVNDGTGQLAESQAMDTYSIEAALGDLDGDGAPDLLLTSSAGGIPSHQVWRNDGSGSFSDAGQWLGSSAESSGPSAVILADIDGDTDLDALIGNYQGAVDLAFNDGAGRLAVAGNRVSAPSPAMAHGDFDGDGDPDRIGGDLKYGSRVLQNDGAGNYRRWPTSNNLGGSYCDAVVALHLNGDTDLDALCSDGGGSSSYLNDGSGTLSRATFGISIGFGGPVIVHGDLNGDGDEDVVIGSATAQNRVFLGDGTGGFTDGVTVGSATTSDLALGDLDGDGDLDLVDAVAWSETFGQNDFSPRQVTVARIYTNDSNGGFSLLTSLTVEVFPVIGGGTVADSGSLSLGDLDGDGDLDIVLGMGGQADRVWINDGTNGFAPLSAAAPFSRSRDVQLGDLDGDGDPDLVVAAYPAAERPIRLLQNDGSGRFTPYLSLGETDVLEIELLDLDGDSDLDIATRGAATGFDAVYINQTR